MAVLYHPSLDPSRVYYGTDTRACELLFGAALAMVWPSRRLQRGIARRRATIIDGAGVRRPPRDRAYVLADRRILALPLPRRLRAALDRRPCSRSRRWPIRPAGSGRCRLPADALDRRTLLRHLPLALPGDRPHLARGAPTARACSSAALQVAAILGIAELSWRYVENPVRHGALGRLWRGWGGAAGAASGSRSAAGRSSGSARWSSAIAVAGLAGVGVSTPSRASGKTVAKTVKRRR